MEFIRKYAWAFVLGGAFSIAGWTFLMWQFYAAVIPIVILVIWSQE